MTHGHQKIHRLSDLLQVRRSKSILMQMLQNTAVSVLQRRRNGRLKEIGGEKYEQYSEQFDAYMRREMSEDDMKMDEMCGM